MLVVPIVLSVVLSNGCGWENGPICTEGQSCCANDIYSLGNCYNKSVATCTGCGQDTSFPCPLSTPHCCLKKNDGAIENKDITCYGEGQQCCADSGKVAKTTEYCIGKCGIATDPFTQCCYTNSTYNHTYDSRTDKCTTCGVISLSEPNVQCCGLAQYNNKTETCCSPGQHKWCANDHTCSECGCLDKADPDTVCCGSQHKYNPTIGDICCQGVGFGDQPETVKCDSTQDCVHYKFEGNLFNFPYCCKKGWVACATDFDGVTCMDPETSICCSGAVCSKTLGTSCCGGACCK